MERKYRFPLKTNFTYSLGLSALLMIATMFPCIYPAGLLRQDATNSLSIFGRRESSTAITLLSIALEQQVGKRIRSLREKRGWSQEALHECGFQPHVYRLGRTRRAEPDAEQPHTIAKTLKVTMAELLKGID